jgi:hypothetical protein
VVEAPHIECEPHRALGHVIPERENNSEKRVGTREKREKIREKRGERSEKREVRREKWEENREYKGERSEKRRERREKSHTLGPPAPRRTQTP